MLELVLQIFTENNQQLTGQFEIPNVSIITAILTNNNSLSVSSSLSGSGNGSIYQNNSSTLYLGGTSAGIIINASENQNSVIYNGASQIVNNTNYWDLGLQGSGTKTLQTGTTSISRDFILNSSSSLSVSAVENLTIGRNFFIENNNIFYAGSYIQGVKGDFINNGTFTAGTSTVLMNGTGAQAILGNVPTTFNNLTINNSAGITLSTNETVAGTLTLTSGLITTGSNTLTIGASGNISDANATHYINGKLAHIYSATGSKTFPVGKGGVYRPLTLNYTALSGTSTVTAEQFESTLPGTAPANITLFAGRYWSVTESGSTSRTYSLTLDGTGIPANKSVSMIKGDNGTNVAYTTTGTAPEYTHAGFTGFSDFALGTYDQITWTGSVSAEWSASGNWDIGTVPLSSDNVTIASSSINPHITVASAYPTVLNNLAIQSGAILTVDAGMALTVNGTITNSAGTSGLVIKSDVTGDGKLINNTPNTTPVSGTVELYLKGGSGEWGPAYHYFVPPVASMAINNTTSGGHTTSYNTAVSLGLQTTNFNGDLLNYLESEVTANKNNGWQYFDGFAYLGSHSTTSFSSLVSSQGYNIYLKANDKITFTGALNCAQPATSFILTKTSADALASGWNLVGNPYPCNYDLSVIPSVLNTGR